MIYFAVCGPFVKIGCTKHLWERLDQIQAGSPYCVELLSVIDGEEKEIHTTLSASHYRAEWYYLTDEVFDFVRSIPQLNVPPPKISGVERKIFRTKDGWFVASNSRARGPFPTRGRARNGRERTRKEGPQQMIAHRPF
jgi:hypothetical protein